MTVEFVLSNIKVTFTGLLLLYKPGSVHMTSMVCESVLSASFIGLSCKGLLEHFVIVCVCFMLMLVWQ